MVSFLVIFVNCCIFSHFCQLLQDQGTRRSCQGISISRCTECPLGRQLIKRFKCQSTGQHFLTLGNFCDILTLDLICCLFVFFSLEFWSHLLTLRGFCGFEKTLSPWSRGLAAISWAWRWGKYKRGRNFIYILVINVLTEYLGKILMFTAIMSVLDVLLLESRLIFRSWLIFNVYFYNVLLNISLPLV